MERLKDQEGQVAVLAAICFAVFLLAFGVVIDVASWHADAARLQQGADAAAISGAQFYLDGIIGTAEPATNPCVGQPSPGACAAHVAALNNVPLASAPALVTVNGITGVQVIAQDISPPNFIAKTLGINPKITARATASAVGPGSETGAVMPIAVSQAAASQWQSNQLIHLTFDDTSGRGFIATTLPDSGGPCGNGESFLSGCIKNGCGCTVKVGDTVDEIPGNRWHNKPLVQKAWDARLGDTVLVAVYDPSLKIIGFATFVIGPSLPNDDIQVTFKGITTASSGSGTGQFFGTASVAITE